MADSNKQKPLAFEGNEFVQECLDAVDANVAQNWNKIYCVWKFTNQIMITNLVK